MEQNFSNDPIQNNPVRSGGGGNAQIMAIASLVLGVVNLCAWFLPICGIPLALAGLVLGFFGMKDPSQKTIAIIGMALCGLSLLLACGNSILGVLMNTTDIFSQFQQF